jgi:hypothetical protein
MDRFVSRWALSRRAALAGDVIVRDYPGGNDLRDAHLTGSSKETLFRSRRPRPWLKRNFQVV